MSRKLLNSSVSTLSGTSPREHLFTTALRWLGPIETKIYISATYGRRMDSYVLVDDELIIDIFVTDAIRKTTDQDLR